MKKVLALTAMLIGLSACHLGMGVGDNGQQPNYVATDAFGSAVAQASLASND